MKQEKNRICPVEQAGHLDNSIRRWFQNPKKILSPYIVEGMTILDIGCGPGFFSIDMAEMTGPSGRVVAMDLQPGMLDKLRNKIEGAAIEKTIRLHQGGASSIGIAETVDFALAFYMVHEVPDQSSFFSELRSILAKDGSLFVVEPNFHVSKKAFEKTVAVAASEGFHVAEKPKVFFSKAVLLKPTR
jgi:ubiquinone/menaquinone biosynthesis C-methylase UbiE